MSHLVRRLLGSPRSSLRPLAAGLLVTLNVEGGGAAARFLEVSR